MAGRFACSGCVFVLAFVLVLGKTRDDYEIDWGYKSSVCITDHVTHPTTLKTYDAPNGDQPIVGIFVTRDVVHSVIWGEGPFWGWEIVKSYCYTSCYTTYSVSAGPSNAPYQIDITFGTNNPNRCKYGYTVKVCFKALIL